MKEYQPGDWYWVIDGDETQVFSSRRNAMVPVSDVDYIAWGNKPTPIDSLDAVKEVLVAANIPPYAPVTPRQARLALFGAGLLDQVEAAVNGAGGATKITWEYATQIRRDDPLIAQIGSGLGLSESQIDALFTQAVTL